MQSMADDGISNLDLEGSLRWGIIIINHHLSLRMRPDEGEIY